MKPCAPQNWHELKEIFYRSLNLSHDERSAFLDTACGENAKLRSEAEEMLASFDSAGGFLEAPPIAEIAEVFASNGLSLTIGQSFGRYRILRPIGSGGMGEVYLAEDLRLGRNVALKILRSGNSFDPEGMRRFNREAKLVSTLNHPNILTIYENGEENSITFIASEYVEGNTLTELLRSGPLDIDSSLDIAVQMVGALFAAHESGIIHRDIKPDNIMIRPDGVVKLLDFGIAKLSAPMRVGAEPGTTPGMIIGTPNYLSPEQARAKELDARSDIFSFGLLFYEMLSGVKAFDAENAIDVISSILEKEPVPVGQFVPEISVEIDAIVSKCLKKDPDERYSTAAELLTDLKRARQGVSLKDRSDAAGHPERSAATARTERGSFAGGKLSPATAKFTLGEYIARNRRSVALVAAFVILAAGSVIGYLYSTARSSGERIESIAVLPFANESNDPDADYLSDGIAETLIGSLSRLPELDVRPRSSAFSYKGRTADLKQAAKELKVQAILSGRVSLHGNELTLYVELIDIAADKILWSQTYKQPASSLILLQSEITRDVSDNLRYRLSGVDQKQIAKSYTDNADAYRLYLKGNYEWNKHTIGSLQKAIAYYQEALNIDPNYVLAYTGLAKTYGVLGNNYLPPGEALPKAREYSRKALDIDDSIAEAHAVMAAVRSYYDWDAAAGQKEAESALAIDPNNALAHSIKGSCLEALGRFDEALIERKRAVDIDPLSAMDNWMLGSTYYLKGDSDRAILQLQQTIDMEPRFSPSYLFLGQAYEQKKMYGEAIKAYQSGLSQDEGSPKLIASLAHAYALSGDLPQAKATLARLRETAQKDYVNPYLFAIVFAGLGEKEKMFASLEKAFQERPADMLWLGVEPMFSQFHDDPRFEGLLKRIGVEDSVRQNHLRG